MEKIRTSFNVVDSQGEIHGGYLSYVEPGKELERAAAISELYPDAHIIRWENAKAWGMYMTGSCFEDLVAPDDQMDLPYEGS